jgi:hypothetical protein
MSTLVIMVSGGQLSSAVAGLAPARKATTQQAKDRVRIRETRNEGFG